jgi:predicted DNA-binding transcriptional regulator AlpA
MKNFPFKPKHSAMTSAEQQTLLISAIKNVQAVGIPPVKPELKLCKASNPVQLPDFDSLSDSGFVRLPSLLILFSCSRATIWRWVKAEKLPAPKKLGPRISAWNVREIREVISCCMNGGQK